MTQPMQSGQYNDQSQPVNNYGQQVPQQYPYQGYPPPATEYQYQGYQQQTPAYPPQNYYQPQYQPPQAPPPPKGFPGWAWGLIGLAGIAIIAVVIVAIIVTSNKTVKTDPTATTNPTSVATTAAATTTVNSATTTAASTTTAGATTTVAVTTKPATTTAATTTKPATTTAAAVPTPDLEEGWTNFKPANGGFSIALPEGWESVDQDTVKSFLDEGLKQLQSQNPQFSSSLGNQVKAVFASGLIKFFGFDTSSLSNFTVNVSVGKQPVPASTTLASYVQLNLSQIQNAVKLAKPAEQKKVTLADGEAVQLKYEWSITIPATGQPANITTIQYMFINNKNAYVVTFTCLSDQLDERLPLFEQIMDTFRVTD